jgi:hypothetical protein
MSDNDFEEKRNRSINPQSDFSSPPPRLDAEFNENSRGM